MATVICPNCLKPINANDVNVERDVALCRSCGELTNLSDIVDDASQLAATNILDDDAPVADCTLRDDGSTIRIIAGARSFYRAVATLAVAICWNFPNVLFGLIALAGTLHHLTGSDPSWLPAQVVEMGDATSPIGVAGLWLILTPFLIVGFTMAFLCLVYLVGRCEVRLNGEHGLIFTGVGPIGWRRRFDASAVQSIRLTKTRWKYDGEGRPCILIRSTRDRRLGFVLEPEPRNWMAATLRRLLIQPHDNNTLSQSAVGYVSTAAS